MKFSLPIFFFWNLAQRELLMHFCTRSAPQLENFLCGPTPWTCFLSFFSYLVKPQDLNLVQHLELYLSTPCLVKPHESNLVQPLELICHPSFPTLSSHDLNFLYYTIVGVLRWAVGLLRELGHITQFILIISYNVIQLI